MAVDFKEMDDYIQKRRARYGFVNKAEKEKGVKPVHNFFNSIKDFFSGMFSRKQEIIDLSPESEEIEDQVMEESSAVSPEDISEEPEEVIEEQVEPWHIKMIKKISGFFKKKGEVIKDEEVVEEVIEIDYEEIKQAFKISNSLIKKLSPAILKAFRESEDYRIYRNMMDKLGLIKKK